MEINNDVDLASAAGGVPPGFRFHPTEEELVGYYLKRKIDSLKIDLDVIVDVDLYRMEPWDIQDKCKLSYSDDDEQTEWYFFSHKDKKYPTGTRTNRATAAGFWKATGRDKAVVARNGRTVIGMRKTLVFYRGRAPNGRKTDWIVHEYRLQSSVDAAPQEEGWVVCRAFKKPSPRTNGQQQYYLGTTFETFRNHNGSGSTDHYYAFRENSSVDYNHRCNTNILGAGVGACGASPSCSSIPELCSPNSLSIDNTITPLPPAPSRTNTADFTPSIFRSSPPQLVNLTHQHHYDKERFGFGFTSSSDREVRLDDMIPPHSTTSTCGGGGGGLVNLDHEEDNNNNNDDDSISSGGGWKLLESLLASDDVAFGEPPPEFPLNGYDQHSRRHSSTSAAADFYSDSTRFDYDDDQMSDQVGHFLAYFSEF